MELKKAVVGPLWSNVYIVSSKKEGVIIDAGAEPDKILSLTQGISITYILLTHNHPDHISVVEPLKKKLGVKFGIHPLDKTPNLFDFEIKDGDKIHFGEDCLKVIHTPGHTPGSCCFLVGSQLFSGDTIFLGGYGRTNLGGNEEELFKSIEKIMNLPPETQIYPGHGPSTTVEKEREFYIFG